MCEKWDVLEVRVLGELEVLRDGKRVALPASKRTRALLGYLVATRQSVLRERLCDLLWDGPDDPRAALRWSLAKLRPIVDDKATRLVADRERVSFDAQGARVDLSALKETGELAAATVAALEKQLGAFRGELLDGLDLPDCHRYQAWLSAEREAARTLRVAMLAELVARHREQPEIALKHAHTWLTVEPLSELANAAVARAQHALGRTREAMRTIQEAGQRLAVEAAQPPVELERARVELARPAPPRNRLVGRTSERALVREAVRAAADGVTQVVCVLGEPGIGKSCLLEDLADQVRAAGGRVLAGRAFEAELVRPYGAWLDALRALPEAERPDELRNAIVPAPASGFDPADRGRLFDAVVAAFRGLAATTRPLAVLLDDIHWLDESGAALLSYVGRTVTRTPLLLACAARPGELGDNRPAREAIRALDRDGRLTRIELGPLGCEDIAALVGDNRAYVESGGNPLYAIELARAASQGRDAESLDRLLGDRLAALDGRARDVLPFAAALGRSFSIDLLAAVVRLPPADLLAAVEDLERKNVLRSAGGGYDFIHDLVRNAACRGLSEPRRRLVHREIAQAMSQFPDEDASLAGELAHHATLGGLPFVAARAAVRAGERCLRVFAHADAERLVGRSLSQLDALSANERIDVEIPLYRVQTYALQSRTPSHALDGAVARAVIAAEGAGRTDRVQEGFQLMAMVHWRTQDFERAFDNTLRAAEAARQVDPTTAARGLATTSRCLALIERDMDQAVSMALEARELATRQQARLGEVAWALAMAYHYAGEEERALVAQREAVELNHAAQEHWGECMCNLDMAMLELELEHWPEALGAARAASEVARRLGEGSELPFAAALEALAAAGSTVELSDDAVAKSVQALRDVDAKAALAYVLNHVAERELERGRFDVADGAASEALASAAALGRRSEALVAHAILARSAAERGNETTARRHRAALLDGQGAPMSARARKMLSTVLPQRS
jgi:DNA-binding SARP family transcriptional activator